MTNIKLINRGIDDDVAQMTQATTTMVNAVEEFVALVRANIESFQGNASDEFSTRLNTLVAEAQGMNSQFGVGTRTLASMADQVNAADRQGGALIGGA